MNLLLGLCVEAGRGDVTLGLMNLLLGLCVEASAGSSLVSSSDDLEDFKLSSLRRVKKLLNRSRLFSSLIGRMTPSPASSTISFSDSSCALATTSQADSTSKVTSHSLAAISTLTDTDLSSGRC